MDIFNNIRKRALLVLDKEKLVNKYLDLSNSCMKKNEELEKLEKELEVEKMHNEQLLNELNSLKDDRKANVLTLTVKLIEIDEVKDIIASFIFMLEDTRIDRDIRLQYLESCKRLKEGYFVRIDK